MLMRDRLLHLHQFIPPRRFLLVGHVPVEPRRRRVGLERIGEHTHPLKLPLLREGDHLLELFAGLAGEAGDERRPQHEAWDPAPQFREQLFGRPASHAALHPLQHRVAGMLEGHVEIGNDLRAGRDLVDEAIGEVDRIEIHQADPLDAVHLLEFVEQFHEPGLAVEVHPVVGGVLRDDHQFLHAVGGEFTGLANHLLDRLGGMLAPHLGNRAEGAGAVAALGDLEVGHVPRCDPHAARVVEGAGGRGAKDAPLIAEAADEPFGRAGDLVPREDADHGIHSGQFGEQRLFLPLGQAAGHDHTPRAARPLQVEHLVDRGIRLLAGGVDEGAGVHDHDVGALRLADELPAVLAEQAEHPLAIDEVFRAAEADHGKRAAAGGRIDRQGGRHHGRAAAAGITAGGRIDDREG